ncbi:CobW family GTP-binding protein [Deinococcus marmoris]|uniref:Metal chaperone, involved in Zn homeostasis, GTPase n=1 Tax=Deinococcus marmoris TaxID=249408 RepID=A0A1U7NX93_9DEIO|nr:GTP-binding protein [Deinococcus marmoris]OLV17524.1 metal chaperone, involved in Zn homeostasis, GTPase [Deinococcus marmoris]
MTFPASPSVPITVLCGFLGAGKTTLLNHLIRQSGGKKIAVIVNEFGAVNIDASLVVKTDEQTIELSNGCICCTLRGDLLLAVEDLLDTRTLDAILIESTGIGEPLPIAQSFCLTPEELEIEPEPGQAAIPNLLGRVHVDAMVTVVDSAQFFDLWNRQDTIPGDDFERGFGELLAEQLEFADIVVLNKTDLAAPDDVQQLRELVGITNPRARLLDARQGQVDVAEVLDVGLFDFDQASQMDAWMAELEKEHTPESETYGLGTHIYRAAQPFDSAALQKVLVGGLPRNVIRSKGWVNLGDGVATLWNHTGRQLALETAGEWHDPAEAFSEIVFIGRDLDGAELDRLLEGAVSR